MLPTWTPVEYNNWLENGCPISTSVRRLDLFKTQLTTLDDRIDRMTNLEDLSIDFNLLTVLPDSIGNLKHCRKLWLSGNSLTTLPHTIGGMTSLVTIHANNNRISELPVEIGSLIYLEELWLIGNELGALPSTIGDLENLRSLWVDTNKLTIIPPQIGQLQNLETLVLFHNQLTTLPIELGLCRNLGSVLYFGNPIEYVPPNILRIVDRQRKAKSVYDDTQSVHNTHVQQCVRESVIRLLSIKPILYFDEITELIIGDDILAPFTKESLVEYCKDESVHSTLDITFADLLVAVWNRISKSEHLVEIKNILNIEMQDASCKCFTGRMSRLLNCLNGFDPLVEIKIGDCEQIGTIISLVKTQLGEEYTIAKHKTISKERLLDLGYEMKVIDEWLEYII